MQKKILVSTGARAEYGILRSLLKEIQKSKKLKLILIVTGSHLSKNHGYTINEIKKDGFKIPYSDLAPVLTRIFFCILQKILFILLILVQP